MVTAAPGSCGPASQPSCGTSRGAGLVFVIGDREQPLAKSGRNSVLHWCMVAPSRVTCLRMGNGRTLSEGTPAVPRDDAPGTQTCSSKVSPVWRSDGVLRAERPPCWLRAVGATSPEEVPARILNLGRWRLTVARAWNEALRIHLFVVRAAVFTTVVEGKIIVSLSDNMCEILSTESGRATNRALNAPCHQSLTWQLFGDIDWRRRHVLPPRLLPTRQLGGQMQDS